MDHYVTGAAIKALREKKGLTQAQLGEKLTVSDKAVSKWETGRGLPDITLLEPLALALGVSVPELLSGQTVVNQNRAANMLKARFYVCPVCGNVLHTTGAAAVSCCGIPLPALEAEAPEGNHEGTIQREGDELYVSFPHPQTKEHYLSFLAYVTTDRTELVKLYPESTAEARFFCRGKGKLYWYCTHDGLYGTDVKIRKKQMEG